MRVVFLCKAFPKLSETFILSQVTGLLDLGHDVRVCAHYGQWDPVHPEVRERDLARRVTYPRLGPRGLAAASAQLARRAGVGAVARQLGRGLSLTNAFLCGPGAEPADVVHAHFGPSGFAGAFLKREGLHTGPLVTSFYGRDVTSYPLEHGRDCYRAVFAASDEVLALSEHMRGRLIELGCPPAKAAVHHLATEVERFPFAPRVAPQDGVVRVLCVGRMVEKKGFEYAVRAFAAAAPAPARLRVVGDGPLRGDLEGLAETLGVRDRVDFLGSRTREEVRSELIAAHLFMAPSVRAADGDEEGTPTVIVEAMAAGLPVLATRHSGIPEQVVDGATGALVAERDADALGARLGELIAHPERWAALGTAGRRHAEAEFDAPQMNRKQAERYEALRRACAPPPREPPRASAAR